MASSNSLLPSLPHRFDVHHDTRPQLGRVSHNHVVTTHLHEASLVRVNPVLQRSDLDASHYLVASERVSPGVRKSVASCVSSSVPDQARKHRAVTKLRGLETNRLGNINSIRNRQVASSTLALGPSLVLTNQ
jgi:hypothetical protein